jgi:acetylornithine/succinyldiaminopimelate/putrescine aminotransferase
LLVNRTSTNVVRMLPPYITTPTEVDEALEILSAVLAQ